MYLKIKFTLSKILFLNMINIIFFEILLVTKPTNWPSSENVEQVKLVFQKRYSRSIGVNDFRAHKEWS